MNSKGKILKTFVPFTSKNSASVVDTDPGWILIRLGHWIQEDFFLWRAGGFFWKAMEVLYIFKKFNKKPNFSTLILFQFW